MTIGLIVPTLYGGGAEKVVVNLANYLSLYDKVYIVSDFEGGDYTHLVDSRVNCYPTEGKTILKIKQFIDDIKPDLVMSTLPSANAKTYLALKIAKHRPIFIVREARILNKSFFECRDFKNAVAYFFTMLAYKYCDYVIANSPDTKDSIVSRMQIDPRKITVIGNPVIGNDIINSNADSITSNQSEKYILAVGRYVTDKRFDILINAFSLIQNQITENLYIYGHGSLERELQALIDEKNLNNRVFLRSFTKDIIAQYKNASCFVSSSDFEGFGNVLVEALSCGLPIISTNCKGGPKYILDSGKYGILVPCGDSKLMSKAILDVIERRVTFERTEQINRSREFSIENSAQKYRNHFSFCLQS